MSRCMKGLDCANTMGPMIADAPGQCVPKCTTFRDQWGNCVPGGANSRNGCKTWFDGCNTCHVTVDRSTHGGHLTACTKKRCYRKGQAMCKDGH